MDLYKLTIKEAGEKLQKGKISSLELTKSCLKRIKEVNSKINACLTVCDDKALGEAKEADARREQGESGELLGIPYLAKDNIMAKGVRTTAASKILDEYIAPYNATVIKRLKEAGAVLLGKTNLDEFAHGASTENSAYGATSNPWDTGRVPGGSSGGSAAAVASDMCIFALGTDTGGSIRHPAGYCGVVGLKPTYGRSSRYGLIAMTSSTDVPGPLCKSMEDAAVVLKAISGVDQNDSTTVDVPVDDYTEKLGADIKGMKIGLPKEFFIDGMDFEVEKTVREAIKKLESLGAEIVDINLPHTKYAVATYYIITPSEISSNLSRFDGIKYGFCSKTADKLEDVYRESRGQAFGAETKRRVMIGTFSLSSGYYDAYYLKAQKVRTIITEELDRELENVDMILTPTAPGVAFEKGKKADPLAMYLEDIFLSSASLAGLPAVSVPCGFVNSMPVGFQLIGKRFGEASLFQLADVYEKNTDWHTKRPSIN